MTKFCFSAQEKFVDTQLFSFSVFEKNMKIKQQLCRKIDALFEYIFITFEPFSSFKKQTFLKDQDFAI